MKQIIAALTGLLLTATNINAKEAELRSNNYVLSSKVVSQTYENIVVKGDVDVTLVEGSSNQLTLEGYQNDLDNVSLEVVGNTLYVNVKTAKNGKKPLVYIPVTNLKHLDIKGNSNVKTLGYLQSNFDVFIASECHLDLKSTGKISILETSTQEFIIEKWEIAKI